MKKLLINIALISLLCTACSPAKQRADLPDSQQEGETLMQEDSQKGSGEDDNGPESWGYNMNFLKCRTGDHGDKTYGEFAGEDIVYDGNDVEIGVTVTMDFEPDIEQKTASLLTMLFLDGKLIPFSIDDSAYERLHPVALTLEEEQLFHVTFTPYGVSENEEKEVLFIGIPFYDKDSVQFFENSVLFHNMNITSINGSLEAPDEESSREYETPGSLGEFDSTEAEDFQRHVPEVRDVFLHKGSGLYYVGTHETGAYLTLLFCDGQLYPGFDGAYSLLWENDGTKEYVCRQIDRSGLGEGHHVLFALTINTGSEAFGMDKAIKSYHLTEG